MMNNKEVYQKVTKDIIESLDKGNIPWKSPYLLMNRPHNPESKAAGPGRSA